MATRNDCSRTIVGTSISTPSSRVKVYDDVRSGSKGSAHVPSKCSALTNIATTLGSGGSVTSVAMRCSVCSATQALTASCARTPSPGSSRATAAKRVIAAT
jgi:hypothetical protein